MHANFIPYICYFQLKYFFIINTVKNKPILFNPQRTRSGIIRMTSVSVCEYVHNVCGIIALKWIYRF